MSTSTDIIKAITDKDGTEGTIYLYGYIGQEPWQDSKKEETLTDVAVMRAIKKLERSGCTICHVRINSPGGRMKDGDAIMNLLEVSKMEIHTYNDGIAASMAADIWMKAKKENRHMASNAKLMIHGPIGGGYGNIQFLEKEITRMEKYEQAAINQMVEDTGLEYEEIKKNYYDGEDHWLTANDALEAGLMAKADTYEAESMPTNPEKMEHKDLVKFYSFKTEMEDNIFKRLRDYFSPKKAAEEVLEKPFIEEEDMNLENIMKAVESGEINKEDLLKSLDAQAIPTEPAAPTTPAADPAKVAPVADIPAVVKMADVEAMVAKAVATQVEKATKPLQETIDAQKAEIEKLGNQPAATPSGVASKADVPGGIEYNDAEKKILKSVQAQNKAMEDGEAIRIK